MKVLDFGLAKFFETDSPDLSLSQSPTVIMSVRTEESVILGTAPYMSPEQARGRPVTKQTDIWALGCVLFEMLTQRQVYSGETVSDTIAKILKEEPDWLSLEAAAPFSPAAHHRAMPAEGSPATVSRCRRCSSGIGRSSCACALELRAAVEATAIFRPCSFDSCRAPAWNRRWSVGISARILKRENWTGTLLSGPSTAFVPRVSPDGKMLAFLTLIDGQSQVAVMNPLSGNWTVLTHGKEQGGTPEFELVGGRNQDLLRSHGRRSPRCLQCPRAWRRTASDSRGCLQPCPATGWQYRCCPIERRSRRATLSVQARRIRPATAQRHHPIYIRRPCPRLSGWPRTGLSR